MLSLVGCCTFELWSGSVVAGVVIAGEMIIDRVRILVHRVSYSVNNVFHFPFFFIPTEKTLLTE